MSTNKRRKGYQFFNSFQSSTFFLSHKNSIVKSPDFLSAKRRKVIRRFTITRKSLSFSFKIDTEQVLDLNNNNLSSDEDSLFSDYGLDRDDDAVM